MTGTFLATTEPPPLGARLGTRLAPPGVQHAVLNDVESRPCLLCSLCHLCESIGPGCSPRQRSAFCPPATATRGTHPNPRRLSPRTLGACMRRLWPCLCLSAHGAWLTDPPGCTGQRAVGMKRNRGWQTDPSMVCCEPARQGWPAASDGHTVCPAWVAIRAATQRPRSDTGFRNEHPLCQPPPRRPTPAHAPGRTSVGGGSAAHTAGTQATA